MYDFVNFIEILNNHEFGSNSIAKAIESISDVFYIGKIEIIGEELSDNMEFVFSDELDENGYVKYNHNDFEYRFYRRKIDYLKDDDQFEDIRLLLRLIALYHTNYLLEKKAEEAEYISLNTRLPNSHGFFRYAEKLVTTVDAKNYNGNTPLDIVYRYSDDDLLAVFGGKDK